MAMLDLRCRTVGRVIPERRLHKDRRPALAAGSAAGSDSPVTSRQNAADVAVGLRAMMAAVPGGFCGVYTCTLVKLLGNSDLLALVEIGKPVAVAGSSM
jgi:hypothetical protein